MTGEKESSAPRCPGPSAQSRHPRPLLQRAPGWAAGCPALPHSRLNPAQPSCVSRSPETALAKNKTEEQTERPSAPFHPRSHAPLQKPFPPPSPPLVGVTDLLWCSHKRFLYTLIYTVKSLPCARHCTMDENKMVSRIKQPGPQLKLHSDTAGI